MSFCLVFHGILFLSGFRIICGMPSPEIEIHNANKQRIASEARAGEESSSGSGGIAPAMANFQNVASSFFSASNMKESKLVMGGFSFFIIPSPDMEQLNPGMFSQLPSFPGGK